MSSAFLRGKWDRRPAGEIHIALAGLGLKSVFDKASRKSRRWSTMCVKTSGERLQSLNNFLLPLSPRRGHLFASSPWHADLGAHWKRLIQQEVT